MEKSSGTAITPRQRVEAVLRQEMPDKTPLTMYQNMAPQCAVPAG